MTPARLHPPQALNSPHPSLARHHGRAYLPCRPRHCTENGSVTPLDDGLPDFYSKRVLPDSQLSSLHKAHSLRRKKRRNMLAIFGFRRNRNSTLSNQEADSLGVACSEDCRTVATAPTGNALENVYTLLQPPRIPGRGSWPGEADGIVEDQKMDEPRVGMMEIRSVQGMPLSTFRTNKHPFYTGKMKSDMEPDHDPSSGTADRELDRQTLRPGDRQASWEMDRQRQIDRELEWQNLRKSESSWEHPMDRSPPSDPQMEHRTEPCPSEERCRGVGTRGTSVGRLILCPSKPEPPPQSSKPSLAKLRQRPLQESSGTEDELGDSNSFRVERKDKDGGMERVKETDTHHPPIPAKPKTTPYVLSPTDSASDRKILPATPPAPAKPTLALTERSHTQGEECVRPQAPIKPQRNRKALSCDTGTDRDSPNNLEKPPIPRNPPVKKPRAPQNRNQSLDYP
ncbi:capping protein, Arp2/3 and myosin-I linker protein 3-like isoform X1, partial [Tachysurus ichikawai]